MLKPKIIDQKAGYIVAYKPPRMHAVFLKKHFDRKGREETLLDWCLRDYPEIADVKGRNPWEGGILHRLDYETEGLVLFARTQEAMDFFLVQQQEGRFSKIYSAMSAGAKENLTGYPPPPVIELFHNADPVVIESGFRPYGPGRRTVRPIIDIDMLSEKIYRTGILAVETQNDFTVFNLWIQRGFRHQIRCHLAWLGFPLANDSCYGGTSVDAYKPWSYTPDADKDILPQKFLALRAQGISFEDPVSGERREYTLPPIVPPL
ncbi:MAG: RNA pseudouridine synthase [Treponema sp.]|jgi:23S rRNA pseudouridine1911/1915/1917 synthase|nr:RNA pseudouridine synthase [Treponema sp.]